jgi:hypothetical protein
VAAETRGMSGVGKEELWSATAGPGDIASLMNMVSNNEVSGVLVAVREIDMVRSNSISIT